MGLSWEGFLVYQELERRDGVWPKGTEICQTSLGNYNGFILKSWNKILHFIQ